VVLLSHVGRLLLLAIKSGPAHSFSTVLQTELEQLVITIDTLVDFAAIVDVTSIMLGMPDVAPSMH
jgi:hypothetical protein